jgi:hypothetical protein
MYQIKMLHFSLKEYFFKTKRQENHLKNQNHSW